MRVALGIASVVLALVYPLAVYYGLTHFGARPAALGLLGVVCCSAIVQLASADSRSVWAKLKPLAFAALLIGASLWLDDRRYLLALPVVINAVLFLGFFGSLSAPMPLVERFARMQVQDLSPAEVIYCRTVTKIWCAFFVVNASIAGLLALLAPLAWWTLYTGLIAYVLIGLLAAGEYTTRKYRFRRYGKGLHDRVFRALFPPGQVT